MSSLHVMRFFLWLVGVQSTSIPCEAQKWPCLCLEVSFLQLVSSPERSDQYSAEDSRGTFKESPENSLCATPSPISSVGLVSPNSQLCLFNSGRLLGLVWVPSLYAEAWRLGTELGLPFLYFLSLRVTALYCLLSSS